MPLARYFLYVGGVLLALLFVVDAYAPSSPVVSSPDTNIEKPIIRIRSDRKWPERVVFDTSIPTIVPASVANAEGVAAPAPVADVPAKARALQSFAELKPADPKQFKPADPKKPEPTVQHKRKISKTRAAPSMVLFAQQPQQPRFGFFANNTW